MKKWYVAGVMAVIAFLAGFIPQYQKARTLENELRAARRENASSLLRDLIGQAYVQASEKNYGLAAGTCSRFFDRAREAAAQAQDPGGRKALEDIVASRDTVTAQLAKGDAGVMGDLQQLYVKTRQATVSAAGQ